MRVAMVIDEQRLKQEQRLLNRVGVGLMAEGVQLIRIVPEGMANEPLDQGERRIALARRIEAPMRSLPWTRGLRLSRVIEALGDSIPDALILCGKGAWPLGLDLARALDRPALVEVWSATLTTELPRIDAHSHIVGFVAASAGIASALRRRVPPELVLEVPMGVAAPRRARLPLAAVDRAPALIVLGGARDVTAYAAMLRGLSAILPRHPGMQVFLELNGPHEHDIWRAAQRLNLLGAVSAIGSAANHRALIMRCDGVLWPERFGELRSLLLEAMAIGLPVIARADDALDMLVDDQTALLVADDDAEQWGQRLEFLVANPAEAQALGSRARERISSAYRSSDQVARLLEAIERHVGADPIVFPAPGSQ
jgi:glycosyltransferase involved in cell wall biosynthesis